MCDQGVGDKAIGNVFARKYERLCNSVAYDKANMETLKLRVHNEIAAQCTSPSWNTHIHDTLLKIFKGSDFQSHIFGNILGKILPDCSPI